MDNEKLENSPRIAGDPPHVSDYFTASSLLGTFFRSPD